MTGTVRSEGMMTKEREESQQGRSGGHAVEGCGRAVIH